MNLNIEIYNDDDYGTYFVSWLNDPSEPNPRLIENYHRSRRLIESYHIVCKKLITRPPALLFEMRLSGTSRFCRFFSEIHLAPLDQWGDIAPKSDMVLVNDAFFQECLGIAMKDVSLLTFDLLCDMLNDTKFLRDCHRTKGLLLFGVL